jgi:predicted Fe-Mo cluster-binding NifX family protein
MKKCIGFLLAASLFVLFSTNTFAGEPSLIAVATDARELTAPVSAVAARCHYFLLFDEQGILVEAVENPFRTASGGAGGQAAEFLAARNVRAVIAGEFGRNMLDAMREKGMTSLKFQGGAAEAVKLALEK